MDEQPPESDRARNPFIVALWVLSGVSLVLGSGGLLASLLYQYSSNGGYSFNGTPSLSFLLSQAGYFLAPSAVTGSLALAGLALAASALKRDGLHARAQMLEEQITQRADSATEDAAPVSSGPTSRFAPQQSAVTPHPDHRPQTTDHDRFKRPSTSRD